MSCTGVVGKLWVEGAFGEVDTAWLAQVPRRRPAARDVREPARGPLAVTPREYCHIFARTPFALVGLEDKDIYRESMRLWDEIAPLRENIGGFGPAGPTRRELNAAPPELCDLYPEVVEYGRVLARRAETMVVQAAARDGRARAREAACVVASGPVLDLVCDGLREQDISYAWIDPAARRRRPERLRAAAARPSARRRRRVRGRLRLPALRLRRARPARPRGRAPSPSPSTAPGRPPPAAPRACAARTPARSDATTEPMLTVTCRSSSSAGGDAAHGLEHAVATAAAAARPSVSGARIANSSPP